ncbi:replicative DNA helicase [Shewanella sp.]|uniref:replicative DNA helicase n=1 Tax=Shewanella sp. TaxID=50422 RepID=UPI0035641758
MEVRLPPNDDEAEEAVIGSLLINGDSIEQVANFLKPSDFYYEANRWLYEAALALYHRREGINQVTMAQELTRVDRLEACGGTAKLSYLISQCPTSLDIEHYANIVTRLSTARQLIIAGDRITAIGYESGPDASASLEKAELVLTSLRKTNGKTDLITPHDRADKMMERYNNLRNLDTSPSIPTGFRNLDAIFGGGQMPGELYVWNAHSKLGKTTLAQDIAINQSQHGDILFCSGEMTDDALGDKEIAKIAGCSVIQIRTGQYDDKLWEKILDGIGSISERKIFILAPPLNIARIRQTAYTMASKYNLKVIWIDYLQKIELFGTKDEQVYRKLGNITADLSLLAKELKVSVNIISQVNGKIDERDNKRPDIGDVYESNKITHDADWNLFIHRFDKYYTKEEWEAYWPNLRDRAKRGWDIPKGLYSSTFPKNITEIILDGSRFSTDSRKICQIVWNESMQSYQNMYHESEGQQGSLD